MDFIIDIQGYRSGKKFVCKELAIVSIKPSRIIAHFVFTTPRGLRNWARTNDWVMSNHHSLEYEQGDVPYSRIRPIFARILGGCKKRVFVKGSEKARWIKQYFTKPVEIVDLITYPSLNGPGYTKQPSCSFFHQKCALRNALKLFYYMLNENHMNGTMPTMAAPVEISENWQESPLPDQNSEEPLISPLFVETLPESPDAGLQSTSVAYGDSIRPFKETISSGLERRDDLKSPVFNASSILPQDKTSEREQPKENDVPAKAVGKKAQKLREIQEEKDDTNEDDAFGKLLTLELKRLKGGKAKRLLKMQINNLLYTHDEE